MVNLSLTSEAHDQPQLYQIDECLWDEIIIHYVNLQKNHSQIGKCFKIINDNLHKRSNKLIAANRVIDRLTELNKLFGYLNDVASECVLQMLETISQDAIAEHFLQFLNQNNLKRSNIVDFLGEFYKADFKASELTAEVWTKMRPISDEGKTRGYSGPAELPLLLLAGGYKAPKGDIIVNNNLLEIKGDGGRIGEFSKWICDRACIDKFINQFIKDRPVIQEQQIEFSFSTNKELVSYHYDFSMLPFRVSHMARDAVDKNLLKCKEDAVNFLGAVQLLEYICEKNDDWFILFKHPGKKTAPFGTSFIISKASLDNDAQSCIKLLQHLQECNITFSPCYDSSGYKIKFAK